jgi:hypothetical protein
MRPPDIDPEDAPVRDPELGRLLEDWTVPALPDALDRRVLASYRTHAGLPVPLWRRFFTTSLRIPLPVAVVVLLALALAFWAPRRRPVSPMESSEPLAGPRTAQAATGVVVTPASSLAGFEPVRDMNVTVLSADAAQ